MKKGKPGRRYLRLKPDVPLYADVHIVRIGAKKVQTGTARVRVLDVSPGGLRFSSRLDFPVEPGILLNLKLATSSAAISLEGYIRHKKRNGEGQYEYGVCFANTSAPLRTYLLGIFGRKIASLGRNIIFLRLD
jgi:hypothetical protein